MGDKTQSKDYQDGYDAGYREAMKQVASLEAEINEMQEMRMKEHRCYVEALEHAQAERYRYQAMYNRCDLTAQQNFKERTKLIAERKKVDRLLKELEEKKNEST